MKSPKITIIGGGSQSWGPSFLRDIFREDDLRGATITLHDIDAGALDIVFRIGQKLKAVKNYDCKLEKTLDLVEAITGSDFVILAISTGGLMAMQSDLTIPERYGIYQTVGDTVGPGGLARALRNIPVLVNIARNIETYAPGAWLLNYTNPMTTLCRAIGMTSNIIAIGLCHEYVHVRNHLAKLMHLDQTKFIARVAGINHFPWILGLMVEDEDIHVQLSNLMGDIQSGKTTVDRFNPTSTADRYLLKAHLFHVYGHLPAAGDRHLIEFFPGLLTVKAGRVAQFGIRRTSIFERHIWQTGFKTFNLAMLNGFVNLETFLRNPSGEAAIPIIKAFIHDKPYEGIINFPNRGQVENLPENSVVESILTLFPDGKISFIPSCLPDNIHGIVFRHVLNQELIVKAALTGNRKDAIEALINDPLIPQPQIANKLLDEMLYANKDYLPQFF